MPALLSSHSDSCDSVVVLSNHGRREVFEVSDFVETKRIEGLEDLVSTFGDLKLADDLVAGADVLNLTVHVLAGFDRVTGRRLAPDFARKISSKALAFPLILDSSSAFRNSST